MSRMFRKMALLLVAVLLTSLTVSIKNVRAATGTIYLSPASASVQSGDTFTTDIRVNPGTAIDTADIYLSFDSSKVTYQSITYAGSPFGTQLGFSNNGSTIHFTSGYLGGSVTSDSFVATVTFKAAVGGSTATLSLTGSNAAYAGTPTNPATAGASITLTSPVSTCPTGQTGTPPNCVTPTPAPTPTPTPDPTTVTNTKTAKGGTTSPVPTTPTPVTAANADVATSVEQQAVQFTQASFTITSKSPTQVYLRYGLDAENMASQTPLSEWGTSHIITLDSSVLVPGQKYYYQVFSKDAQGQTVQAEVTSFTTKGLTVKVGIFDKNNKPLANKKVTIHSTPQTVTTDKKGVATFTDLTPGNHTVSYISGGKTYSRPITVVNNIVSNGDVQASEPQSFSVIFDFTQGRGVFSPLGLTLLAVAIVVIVSVALYLRRGQDGLGGFGDYIPTLNPVTVGGATNNSAPKDEELTRRLESTPMPQTSLPGTVISSGNNETEGKK